MPICPCGSCGDRVDGPLGQQVADARSLMVGDWLFKSRDHVTAEVDGPYPDASNQTGWWLRSDSEWGSSPRWVSFTGLEERWVYSRDPELDDDDEDEDEEAYTPTRYLRQETPPMPAMMTSPKFGVEIEFLPEDEVAMEARLNARAALTNSYCDYCDSHSCYHLWDRIGMWPLRTGEEIAPHLELPGERGSVSFYGYTHQHLREWKLVTDSSCGLELVSKPLEYADRLEVRHMMLEVQKLGLGIDYRCGFHVHHEWPWWQRFDGIGQPRSIELQDRLSRLRKMYAACRPFLEEILSPSRWRRIDGQNFCKTTTEKEKPLEIDFEDRYVDINLNSLTKYGTVEFRQHQGTLNPSKALAWVDFTRMLVFVASMPGDMTHVQRFDHAIAKLALTTKRYYAKRLNLESVDDLVDALSPCSALMAELD